ncbi:MAG TPA: FtsX-like permease family protein [Puia sp.]|nr:FtsX-like permease family protein [Puia sp.]
MFRNYWKIAFRQLGKQKLYALIKIGGFALGIATCLLITLYIRHELSYDRDYPNGDRLYRVINDYVRDDGSVGRGVWEEPGFARAMKAEFPEVQETGRLMPAPLFYGAGSNEVRPEGKTEEIYEEGFTYCDQSVLDMFRTPMVYGDRAHALERPWSIVISKRKADKYFPGGNPVGKLLYLNGDNKTPLTIGGVMADPAPTSHLQFDFLISLAGHELWPGEQNTWMAENYHTYALLKPGTDPVKLQHKLVELLKKYQLPQMRERGLTDPETALKRITYELQPVRDIHLYSAGIDDVLVHGDIHMVWLFGAVGVFILLLAVVNFVNLSTARSAGRAKEVGLRKVVGSSRVGLMQQFLTESLLLSGISFLAALGLAWGFMGMFRRMTDTVIEIPWLSAWWLPSIVVAAVGVGLLAGWYPAVYLSRFRPVEVLKSMVSVGSRRSALRSTLVVFQFTTSVILIIATIVVYKQLRLILDQDLGYNKDQVMLIQGAGTVDKGNYPHLRFQAFKRDLLALSAVRSVSISDFLPVNGGKRNGNSFWKAGRSKQDPRISGQDWWDDPDYFKTMGIPFVKGRDFSYDIAGDSAAVVINENMAGKLGWPDPLGKEIDYGGAFKMHIVGVVKDFNFWSVKDKVSPVVIHRGDWASIVAVKVKAGDMKGVIGEIGDVWKKYAPDQPFRYTFMDETYAKQYADVERTRNMFTSLSVLAVVIACLGLFALSAFMAERRRKEVGIRKVLGATVAQVTGLLTREFLLLVAISIVIATPVAYWGMKWWLRDYVYRITLGWTIFALAGLLVIGIAAATIGMQAFRAARANPAGSLRAE